jgi:hypothetical protein
MQLHRVAVQHHRVTARDRGLHKPQARDKNLLKDQTQDNQTITSNQHKHLLTTAMHPKINRL